MKLLNIHLSKKRNKPAWVLVAGQPGRMQYIDLGTHALLGGADGALAKAEEIGYDVAGWEVVTNFPGTSLETSFAQPASGHDRVVAA